MLSKPIIGDITVKHDRKSAKFSFDGPFQSNIGRRYLREHVAVNITVYMPIDDLRGPFTQTAPVFAQRVFETFGVKEDK